MSVLTTKQRNKMPAKEFALPGGRYPINDANHARNALARAAQHASPAEQAIIERKVHAKFPGIGDSDAGDSDADERKKARAKHVARVLSRR